jgi:hypothetical protein
MHIISHLVTHSMEQSPSWEANRSSARQEIPTFYGTQRFITAFTTARHLSLSWATLIHPCPTIPLLEDNFNIIFPSTPGSSKWSPSLRFFHQNPVYTSSSHIRATCPAHLTLLDLNTWITFDEEYRAQSSLLCCLLHSLLGRNILISTLFLKILCLLSSLNVRGHVTTLYLRLKFSVSPYDVQWWQITCYLLVQVERQASMRGWTAHTHHQVFSNHFENVHSDRSMNIFPE